MSSKVVFNFKTKENLTGIIREMNSKSSDIWDRYKCGYICAPIKNGRFIDIDLLKVHGGCNYYNASKDKKYIILGFDCIDKEIFENFSNTLLKKMLEELEELKELENKD